MLTLHTEGEGIALTLTAQSMGRDWNVTITGGEVPHLGAAALGDIGKLFPETDERYKGADSLVLLGHVAARVRQAGFAVENIDATVLCQRPKLAAHIPAMREKLAAACGMDAGDVSVKATTEEGLGFTGEGLGIAAHCVCLLRRTGGGR